MEPTVDAPKGAPKLFGGFGVDTLLAGLFLLVGTIVFLAFAPFTYDIYLAVHVIAAVVWVGGDVTLTTLGIVFERRGEGETLGALGRMGAWIGTRVYTPTLFVVIGFGIALMLEADIDWGQFWVIFGLIGWAIATLRGYRVRRPRAGPHRRGGTNPRARLARGGGAGEAAVHDLPLRHCPARVDRDRHDRKAVCLGFSSLQAGISLREIHGSAVADPSARHPEGAGFAVARLSD